MNFKITGIFLLLFISVMANAQMKRLETFKNTNIKNDSKRIQIVDKANREQTQQDSGSIDFHPMDYAGIATLKTGLKPGILNANNVPVYIEGALPARGLRGNQPENMAYEYLTAAAPLMKINHPVEEFVIKEITSDDINMVHVRMQQQAKGIPVYGAEIIIHGDGSGFDFLNGTYYPSMEWEYKLPSVSAQDCTKKIYEAWGEIPNYIYDISAAGNLQPVTEVVIYPYEDKFFLAYHVTAYQNLIDRWEYFIDAHSGNVINKYQSICKFHRHTSGKNTSCADHTSTAFAAASSQVLLDGKATANAQDLFNINRLINTYQVGSKFYLIDGSRDIFSSTANQLPNDPKGVIWTIDAFNTSPSKSSFRYDHLTSTNNIWTNKTAVSAHYNGGKAFEYFKNVHNRKSINGSGGNIISLINVADDDGSSMGNAFWNGQAMFYGNGDNFFLPLARGLDVAGHEMTHGVVQSTANLEYQGESGALNESFADVFGAMIDRDDWKIGEDVVKLSAFPSGALRDLENPHNGASTNNFNAGWQPKHYNERYKGNEDNGGVHINSGIPNHAFFKIATALGKDKAEKIYYRALSAYLTKSSKFVDCRVAVVKATTDLFGNGDANLARKAFDEVGILGESGGNYETDIETNPGKEFVLTTGANNNGLFLYDTNGNNLGQISNKAILSKPSISDDGSEIIFVGKDNKIYYITLDWTKSPLTPKEQVIGSDPIWRNAIISKDGLKIAALTTDIVNEIEVFYFGGTNVSQNTFTLYNPTYTQGISTGDVNFADAMEFDVTGEYIMYDAENELKSTSVGSISYWDISFIKVWNNASNTFSLGKVDKLYASLPEDVSIGNPSFSKNSPYIIAFDYIDENEDVSILGVNTESGKVSLIFENNTLGYPNYSSKDNRLIFDNNNASGTSINLGVVNLKTNKIEPSANPTLFTSGRRWAVWFSNGKRQLSETTNPVETATGDIRLISNPVTDHLTLQAGDLSDGHFIAEIKDIAGSLLFSYRSETLVNDGNSFQIPIQHIHAGIYFCTIISQNKKQSLKFVKI